MINRKLKIFINAHYHDMNQIKYYYDNLFTNQEEYDIDYVCDRATVYDAVVQVDKSFKKISSKTYEGNMFTVMQEAGTSKQMHPWMYKGLDFYDTVYSPIQQSKNTVLSHGYLGWTIKKKYDELSSLRYPQKTKSVSCIMSNLLTLAGHQLRANFRNKLYQNNINIDYYGKSVNFIEDKIDGLLDYYYSIV